MTVNELLKLISEIMGSDVKEVRLPERPGDIKISSADISLLTEALGKTEFTEIMCALSDTADWYKDNYKK
jgi:nucleoside-diphosphate-sugar epimerase